MYFIWSFLLIIGCCINVYQTCSSVTTIDGCEIILDEKKIICNKYFNKSYSSEHIQAIELYNLNKTVLYLNRFLDNFPNLISFTVMFSNFSTIETKNLIKSNHIQVIRLNNNTNMKEIDENIFNKLENLQLLDLRNNSLQFLHYKNIDFIENISEIYLSGNKWNCSKNVDWAYGLNITQVKDLKNLTCADEYLEGKPLYFIAQVTKRAIKECPKPCNCCLSNVFRNIEIDELQPVVEVNCSTRNFSALPEHLPKYTKILRLDKNNISDISPLVKNPIYREVSDLYIDHNLIHNIDILEGSHWFSNFRVLSLHGNKLTELPTYAMDNALQQNPNMPNAILLYLGSNPWRCDCIFTPGFQEDILVKYESQIQDMVDVKCAYVKGDQNSMRTIVHLSRSSICQLPNEYSVRALDLLNGVLASLIVLVLGKLAYDYYYFKKTGKLPWIVMKMP